MGKKIISFSLWGDKNAYYYGMLENILKRNSVYPDWTIRIYYGDGSLMDEFIPIYKTFEYVECIDMIEFNKKHWGKIQTSKNMMWRFLPCFENKDDIEVVLFRDNDSVFTKREANAVNTWLKSDKIFHIMKDNRKHSGVILGGMWGFKNDNSLIKFKNQMINYPANENDKGVDMFFIKKIVYKIASQNCMITTGNDASPNIISGNNDNIEINQFIPYYCNDFVGKPISKTPLAFKYLNIKPIKLFKKPWGESFDK